MHERSKLHVSLRKQGSEKVPEEKEFVRWLIGLALEEYKAGTDTALQDITTHLRAKFLQAAFKQLVDVRSSFC